MNITQSAEGIWGIEQDTHVFKWICANKRLDHDRFLIPMIEDMLRENMVVIDGGALYGDHSIAYARKISSGGALFCIEANPMAFECLSKNAETFQSPTFLLNCALSDSHGGEAVHVMEENVGASKCSDSKNSEPSRIETKIKTISIDGLCIDANLTTGVDFIKLDIEGGEMAALKGARNLLSNTKFRKPVMVIEMNSFALSLQGSCYKDIYDFLLEMGYEWRIIQPEAGGGSPQYDILAWPKQELEKPKLYKAEVINPAPTESPDLKL